MTSRNIWKDLVLEKCLSWNEDKEEESENKTFWYLSSEFNIAASELFPNVQLKDVNHLTLFCPGVFHSESYTPMRIRRIRTNKEEYAFVCPYFDSGDCQTYILLGHSLLANEYQKEGMKYCCLYLKEEQLFPSLTSFCNLLLFETCPLVSIEFDDT